MDDDYLDGLLEDVPVATPDGDSFLNVWNILWRHDRESTIQRCLVSRIQQYCAAQRGLALNGWWAVGEMDLSNEEYNFDTVYLSIAGTMCSFNTLASMWGPGWPLMGGFVDTAVSRQFIASCRLLAHHAGLHSHRMLC